ncbi:PAS domain S-box protein [Leptolyngbya sp. CCNP1308]|nr:PAS domain S-box protein [Leptolyngbya sp. CCNP1308]
MGSSINNLIDLPNKLPLRVVLIVPLMLLLTGAVGVVGYLSFRNGQRAVNQVANELQNEILHQIQDKLGDYVQVAHDINRLNAIALAKGDINPDSAAGETVFWQQNQIFPTASFVYCGNEKGNLVGVGKMTNKVHLQTWVVNNSTNLIPYFYGLDDQGNRNREFDKGAEPFDARVRPWYKAAKEARQPTWSPIYLGFTTHWPAIATSIPVYDSSGRTLIGACGIDFLLPQEMSQFLKSLTIGKTGSAFIIERSGTLVSTSTAEPIVEITSDGSERLLANQSSNLTIRATADFLEQRFDGFDQIQAAQRLAFDIDGARQFVQVVPFQDRYGLDWLIVIVLPEADYLGQIQSNIRDTLLLCVLALVAALILSVLTARWITRPLLSLNQSAQAIADGEWNQTVNIKRSDELGKLANSFNQMAHQLQTAFLELQTLTQNLAENETRLQAFLESLPISISILDATGHPYYANQRRLQMMGEAIDPTVSCDHLAEVYHLYRAGTNQLYPNDQLPIIQALSGKHTRVDDIEIHQNGRTIPIEVWGTPIFDAQGKVAYAIATFQDITERKQAEKLLADYNCTLEQQVAERTAALQRSEAKFRAIFENSQIGIFQVRIPDGLILDANQRFANLYGFDSPEAMIGLERTRSYYVNPSERQQFLELLKRDKEVRSYEVQMRKRDGTVFWGQFSSYLNAANGYIEGVLADISDRKQAEEALQRSEAKFRTIFENSQVGIYRTRLCDGLILEANQRFADLFGFDAPEEMVGLVHTTSYYVNPNVRQQAIEVMRRDGEVRSFEVQIRKRDGTLFWGLFTSYLNAGDDYIEGVLADISDRKQAEEALQRSEAKFRNIFENSQVGIFRNRISDGLILNANQRLANLLGFDSPEEIIGLEHSIDYFVNPSDREHAREVMKRDGELRSYEVQMRKRDGTLFWGLTSSYLNAADGYVEGVVADVSDRKQAEAALQVSESKLRTLIEAIPDPLFVFSAEGRFLEIMVLEPDLLWHPFEEMIGKTMHQLGREEADEFLGYIQQVLRTQQILTVEYGAFLNGREMWFSARIAPISHDQVIWLVRDITAQKQAEAASILEERNRMAREIHDTLAQAFTGILAQVGAANQVLTDDLEATQTHLDLIKELARTGLTEARRSVVALRPQLLEEGSLQSALHRLVAQTRAAAMDTTLHYEIEGTVYSLPTEVENNLLRMGQEALTNAIRHANADEIRVGLVYDRDQVCLRVRDNGQGFGVGSIPASEGFGLLGMSERAERIGAQLTIRSQPGQGTEIIVTVNP